MSETHELAISQRHARLTKQIATQQRSSASANAATEASKNLHHGHGGRHARSELLEVQLGREGKGGERKGEERKGKREERG